MGEAVEQGRGHLGVAEDGGPFTEAQVGGDDDAGALVEFAQQVEEQGTARCAERQVSQLVQDHEIKPCQAFGDLAGFALGLFLFQGIDQFDGREEADFAVMMLDGLDAQGRGGMGLAGAWAALISPSGLCMPVRPVGAIATGMAMVSPSISVLSERPSIFTATRWRSRIF